MVYLRQLGILPLVTLITSTVGQLGTGVPSVSGDIVPPLPPGDPQPEPAYMKDNRGNFFGTAPDKGSMNGPVLVDSLAKMPDLTQSLGIQINNNSLAARANTDNYWLSSAGSAGKAPFAPAGYQFFRNVKDFGAVGDGKTDDTAAINRAVATYGLNSLNKFRCGNNCGSSTVLAAVVYFPPGTYLISSPIIQYYHTQFVGNPTTLPTIKGSATFKGMALIDNDVYIPGGNGREWYINQSNFYRQIRNFNFDLTGMPPGNVDGGQNYVPTGIHWQVGQATSITNCNFIMAASQGKQSATAVGIFMENGSGGMVQDLTFTGGNIGFFAGGQQFTAVNLKFTGCLTAIKHPWDWGFTWKNLNVISCRVALNCTQYSGVDHQGTGSISVVDSHFNNVPNGILVATSGDQRPNIVLDNLLVEKTAIVVSDVKGETILAGSSNPLTFNSWASGYQYLPNGFGGKKAGFIDPPPAKSQSLLDKNGAYFVQPKPQYPGASPIIATANGIANDATGDQTAAINKLLSSNVGKVIFFPGGIYMVKGTVHVPVGSIITGSGWSQIMGTGSFFQDVNNPQVVVQVGKSGDKGSMQISDMLFTVQGPTAGAILLEWNVHESAQGNAAMWDSHFRVGGAQGSNLQLADCPTNTNTPNKKCMAASLLMHVTGSASGYFENVWAWVADHDLDNPLNAEITEGPDGIPVGVKTDISVYAARGILIESQGPTWFYGSASEHSQLYQYQISNAKNIFLGHMQTETPYYQPKPNALSPYTPGKFPNDPNFRNCANDVCRNAWALRVIHSSDVFIYSAGFYSFFQAYKLGCAPKANCQLALIDTDYTTGLWMYNIFTIGNQEIVSPEGGLAPLLYNGLTRNGYTSEVAAWLQLAVGTANIGQDPNGGSGYVTIDPAIWSNTASATVGCFPPCTYVLPPLTLPTKTTYTFPLLTTAISVGYYTTLTSTVTGKPTTTSVYLVSIDTTVITIPPVTTSVLSWFDVTVTDSSTVIYPFPIITQTPFTIRDTTVISGSITVPPVTRTFYPPPWPGTTVPPSLNSPPPSSSPPPGSSSGGGSRTTNGGPPVTHTNGPPAPSCLVPLLCGSHCNPILQSCGPCWLFCTGPPSFNGPDPNQPGGRPEPSQQGSSSSSSTSSCTTSTFTSCSTTCTPTAKTSSCSTFSCRDVVGCEEPTSQSECVIPRATNTWSSIAGATDYPELGGGGTLGYTVLPPAPTPITTTIGQPTSAPPTTSNPPPTSNPPTTTKTSSTAWPTNTDSFTGGAFCFSPSNGPHVSFTVDDAAAAAVGFCNANYNLQPGNTFGFNSAVERSGYTVIAEAAWAPDQTNCGAERDLHFNTDFAECRDSWNTDFFCTDEQGDQKTSFGGGYVLNLPEKRGCVLFRLSAIGHSSKEKRLSIEANANSTVMVGKEPARFDRDDLKFSAKRSSLFSSRDVKDLESEMPVDDGDDDSIVADSESDSSSPDSMSVKI